MEFEDLIKQVGKLPVVDTEILLAGISKPESIKVQISRWQKSGKLIQLRRGLYLLAEPYRKINIYELYLASILTKPSYISLEKALEYHGMIPESVPIYTSVTTKRPGRFETPIGIFDYRHIHVSYFWGYEPVTVNQQTAFMATPEKALLDLFYLKVSTASMDYLEELRLQNLEQVSLKRLLDSAKRFGKKKVMNAAQMIVNYIQAHKKAGKKL